jgi:predicted type IV restriction endonuclease
LNPERLNQFVSLLDSLRERCLTEEATKHSLVLPFINILGYDVFNPLEVVPEFIADFGTKKGEKVDYAIIKDNTPTILIECKNHTDTLNVHRSQLFRYFSVTKARFGILTNGVKYQFFTDLDEINKMDESPFLEIDLQNLRSNQVEELKKFQKDIFNPVEVLSSATSLKYTTKFKQLFSSELTNPSEEFISLFTKKILIGKRLNSAIIKEFGEIIKLGSNQYINELLSQKLKSALKTTNEINDNVTPPSSDDKTIVTTQEEFEGYYIIKSIIREIVDPTRILSKDTCSYFSIMLDGKVTKWFTRLSLGGKQKYLIIISNKNKTEEKIPISNIQDLYQHREKIIQAVKFYL